jgi:polysaccharide pyruvyl transferase WcaK-like protein
VTKRNPRIAFFGHFGRSNFGNEATLQAMLRNLRHLLPDAEFTCICTGPAVVAADYKIAVAPSRDYVVRPWASQNRLARLARKLVVGIPSEFCRWLESLRTLRGTDALIVPGTGLLTDAYTLFNWGPYDMFRWSVAAKMCRCELLFVSVGAGPIHTRMGRFFIKTALWLADFRSYRDESSQEYLSGIGFPARRDPLYPDLAFSLPAQELPRGRDVKDRRMVVGIGLMEYSGKYGIERRTNTIHRAYLEALVQFAKWLLTHDYDIRLLIGDLVDTAVTEEFRALLRDRTVTYEDERIIDEPVASFQDVLSQIAATDFVVATRFHNVLFSVLLNKPTIAISFHHKCSSLMSQMGLAEYCQNINQLEAARLIEAFSQLQQNADSIRRTIREKAGAWRDTLDEQYRRIFRYICPDEPPLRAPAPEIRESPTRSVLS